MKNNSVRNHLLKGAAVVTAAALLTACGGGAASSAAGSTATTDNAAAAPAAAGKVYYLNFKPEQDEQWQALAAKYTEETGVPVTVVTAASASTRPPS